MPLKNSKNECQMLDATPFLFSTAVATNRGYAKLFAELGAGSLAVGIALVVLIPFLRKLITDKAETAPAETPATVVPVG
jgi:hypothetical protein